MIIDDRKLSRKMKQKGAAFLVSNFAYICGIAFVVFKVCVDNSLFSISLPPKEETHLPRQAAPSPGGSISNRFLSGYKKTGYYRRVLLRRKYINIYSHLVNVFS